MPIMISMTGVMLPNTNTHNLTQVTHRLINNLCSVMHSHIQQANVVIKHIENLSGDFTFLVSWPSGRAQGKARTKMAGSRPYLVYS